jgi:hypothetical protein
MPEIKEDTLAAKWRTHTSARFAGEHSSFEAHMFV